MTLTVPPEAAEEPFILEMEGQSLGSRKHRRFSDPAVPAEIMMQAFLWLQIVPAEQWAVLVNGKAVSKLPLELLPIDRIKLRRGGTTPLGARVTAKYPRADELRIELSDAPKGVTVEKITVHNIPAPPQRPGQKKPAQTQGLVVELATAAESLETGVKGNLIFEVVREWTPAPTIEVPKPKERRQSYGLLPAVPFEVVGTGRAKRR
jgi:hypothetical protein